MSMQYTYVYLIRDNDTGLHKIGKSDNPEQRLKQLTCQPTILASDLDYKLVDAWLCLPSMEATLHDEFAESRIRGEWFDLDSDDIESLHSYVWQCPRYRVVSSLAEEMWTKSARQAMQERDELERAAWWYAGYVRSLWARLNCVSRYAFRRHIRAWPQLPPAPPDEDFF